MYGWPLCISVLVCLNFYYFVLSYRSSVLSVNYSKLIPRPIRRLRVYRWRMLLFCQSIHSPSYRMSKVVADVCCRRSCIAGRVNWFQGYAGFETRVCRWKKDLVFFCSTKLPVRLLALCEQPEITWYYSVVYVVMRFCIHGYESYKVKNALRGRLTNNRLSTLPSLLSSHTSGTCRRRYNITLLISLYLTTCWTVVN